MMYFTLVLPSSFSRAALGPYASLSYLLRKSQIEPINDGVLDHLFPAIDCQHLSTAAILAAAEGLLDGNDKLGKKQLLWLCVDPINLVMDSRTAVIGDKIKLSAQESADLVKTINDFLSFYGGFLFPLDHQWLFSLPEKLTIKTKTLTQAHGKSLTESLMEGADKKYWHKLFTELQMLLYQHPVNLARQARGEDTVDALWFWGEGKVLEQQSTCWSYIATEDKYLLGLCHLSGIKTAPVAGGLSELPVVEREHKFLVMLPEHTSKEQVENNWAKPLVNKLKNGALQQLTLVLDDRAYHLSTSHLKWWRLW